MSPVAMPGLENQSGGQQSVSSSVANTAVLGQTGDFFW